MTAIQQLLTDHIDIWTAANSGKKSGRGRASGSSSSVYGIKKLRELILELAMCGKLLAEDVTDESGSELLKRISLSRERRLDAGRVKKGKTLLAISAQESTVELPSHWVKTRLANLVNILNGRAYKKEELLGSGTPVLRVGNLFTSDHWYYSDLTLDKDKYCEKGDLLFAWSASFGPFIWQGDQAIFHYHIWKFDLHDENLLYKRFLYTFLLEQTQKIKSAGHGVMMIHMTKEKMENLVVHLPPLAEQHRIVAKVDELMALCDQLEAQHKNAAHAHEQLVSELLGTLTQSQDAADFNANWQRIAANFDTLFNTEGSIEALKQALLQLAVMGKLVPQDTREEPASNLVNRLKIEKNEISFQVKIKKENKLYPKTEDEELFALPLGWSFYRKSEIFNFLNGYAFKSENFEMDGVKLLRNKNISHGVLSWEDVVFISAESAKNFEDFSLCAGDVVLSLDRPIITTGLKYALISKDDLPCLLLQRVAKISSLNNVVSSQYLSIWLQSSFFIENIDPGRSNGVPHISTSEVASMIFPMPPAAEQIRIVAKVDELMAICDQLKGSIIGAGELRQKIADVLVEQALA